MKLVASLMLARIPLTMDSPTTGLETPSVAYYKIVLFIDDMLL